VRPRPNSSADPNYQLGPEAPAAAVPVQKLPVPYLTPEGPSAIQKQVPDADIRAAAQLSSEANTLTEGSPAPDSHTAPLATEAESEPT
jgi:hypothetical protein